MGKVQDVLIENATRVVDLFHEGRQVGVDLVEDRPRARLRAACAVV